MRTTWVTALFVLVGCSVEKSSMPEARIADKLHDCDVIGEGEFNVAFQAETDRCELRCFEAASCADLRDAFCVDPASARSEYLACLDRCGVGGPYACEDGSNDQAIHCDAFPDCEDGSDEVGCDDDAFFVCQDEGRVPIDFKCDGEDDCFDGSDERGCPADSFFTCATGEPIPKLWRCDGTDDCEDAEEPQGREDEALGSDERGCPADAFFVCGPGERVAKGWVCDGVPDCSDGSDEQQDCAALQCRP